MSKQPTTHGRWPSHPRTWCDVPRVGMLSTDHVASVTCRACKRAFREYTGELAAVVDKRKAGAPVTTGRGSGTPGAFRLRINLNAKERAKLEAVVPEGKKLQDWARAILLAAAATLMVACAPPPAWQPGDAPLRIEASDDRAWVAMAAGCEAWKVTGLTCVRARHGKVVVTIGEDVPPGAVAATGYQWLPGGWAYDVTILPSEIDSPYLAATAAHEIGHLLGFWPGANDRLDDHGHLPSDPYNVLMSPNKDGMTGPSPLDFWTLSEIWGVPAWELP